MKKEEGDHGETDVKMITKTIMYREMTEKITDVVSVTEVITVAIKGRGVIDGLMTALMSVIEVTKVAIKGIQRLKVGVETASEM